MVDFITVISIFLDNAMEASIQSDIPKMHIGFTSIMVISNLSLSKTQPGGKEFIPISSTL